MNARFGRLVDDVAREMTAGEPAPGFRARVLERATVEARAPRRSRWAPLGLGVAATATVAVFAALVVFRTPPATDPAAGIAATSEVAPVSGTGREPGVAEPAGGAPIMRAATRVRPMPLSASVLEWRARAIPELDAVAPLTLDDIQPVKLSIAQLDVTPLGMLPITFAPIGGAGGRR